MNPRIYFNHQQLQLRFPLGWDSPHTLRYPTAKGDNCNALQGIWDWSDLPTDQLATSVEQKGGPVFFRLIWLMSWCCGSERITSESHRIYLPWFEQKLKIGGIWSGSKKNTHFGGSQIPLGTQDSIKVVGSRGESFERHDGPPSNSIPPSSKIWISTWVSAVSPWGFPAFQMSPGRILEKPSCKPGIQTWWGNGVRENNTNPSYPTTLPRVITAHAIPTNPVRIANGAIPDTIGRMCLTQIAHWDEKHHAQS